MNDYGPCLTNPFPPGTEDWWRQESVIDARLKAILAGASAAHTQPDGLPSNAYERYLWFKAQGEEMEMEKLRAERRREVINELQAEVDKRFEVEGWVRSTGSPVPEGMSVWSTADVQALWDQLHAVKP